MSTWLCCAPSVKPACFKSRPCKVATYCRPRPYNLRSLAPHFPGNLCLQATTAITVCRFSANKIGLRRGRQRAVFGKPIVAGLPFFPYNCPCAFPVY